MAKYIVDIDGTICTEFFLKNGKKDYSKALPIADRIQHINDLYSQGHEIYYWTARGTVTGTDYKEMTVKQLQFWGCKYTSLSVGDKPHYDVWIDDKAIYSESYFAKQNLKLN